MQQLQSIKAHEGPIWSISTHASLPLLATASQDKTSKVYSLTSHKLLAILNQTHTRSIRSISFKPPLDNFDLPVLAAGSFDSTISIWGIEEPEFYTDIETELDHQRIICQANNEWNLMALIEGHENEVKSVAWNSQGNLLASCSRDKTVWIWETDQETLEEFECIAVLNDHEHDVKYVCWHPTRNILASCSYDDTIRIYAEDEDDEFTCIGVLNGHEDTVWCCQFENTDSDKIRLASVSNDLTVRIWSGSVPSTSTNQSLPSSIKHNKEMVWEQECVLPQAHTFPIYSLTWSSTTGKIATCGSDGKIVVYQEVDGTWEIETTQEASHGVSEVNCILWGKLQDKEILITGGDDGYINYWTI
ncbi:putative cytosolic iron-sulfur protein assembly protein 1 [Spathaspora sp. JA1]|nr:putative cytosolic iron-sulfur protein assembly protein 1 [Spathaspora sp. JA1]